MGSLQELERGGEIPGYKGRMRRSSLNGQDNSLFACHSLAPLLDLPQKVLLPAVQGRRGRRRQQCVRQDEVLS